LALQDKTLKCKECEGQFVFTGGEKEFYLQKGLLNEPQRCPTCRSMRRQERNERGEREGGRREMATVICAACGDQTTIPFVPRLDRPVYCHLCFEKVRMGTQIAAGQVGTEEIFAATDDGQAVSSEEGLAV